MPIEPGQTLLHYRIVDKLGEGGMGHVWRAVDTNLDRQVAIKVLPEIFSQDPERLGRFEREAKLLASLNHPHIAGIYGIHEDDTSMGSVRFLAMELVEGEDLAERLARGRLPVDEALAVSRQIAAALEAAHSNGVVHRDLKPANVVLTGDGQAKVLDFGLAKAAEPDAASASGSLSLSPTMTSAGTVAGVLLGTAAYMSPEQARGKPVDRRADLWALGCVIYECLTGEQLFKGETVSDTLAAVLRKEPDWSRLPADTPPLLRLLVQRCLTRDPSSRQQDAGDARVSLEQVIEDPSAELLGLGAATVDEPEGRRFSPTIAVVAALVLVVAAAATAWTLKPSAAEPIPAPEVRFEVMLPQGDNFSANYNRVVTISPDSRTLAYMVSDGLMLRSLDSTEQRPIPDTQEARSPAFSYDSRQVAFWDNGHIMRISVDGGVPIIVGPLPKRPMGLHWAADDFIYAGRADRGIWRVPASGGELEQVLELEEGEYAHGPELLPGGEWMMFSLSRGVRAWIDGSIVAQSLKTGKREVLVRRGREARYLQNGHLTFVQDNTLFAAPFDLDKLEITGPTEAMESSVHSSAADETGAAGYDVSDSGVLAFAPPSWLGARMAGLTFLDREGNEQPFAIGPRRLVVAKLSPDETRVAAQINDIEGTHIWIISVDRERVQRLTTTGRNTDPVWSHDGRHVYFASVRDGVNDIWRRPADLSAPAEKVLEIPGAELPSSVSTDGAWLYYSRMSPGDSDIARVSLVGEPEVEVLVESPADELDGGVSPDGRFVCFHSNETGQWDIHVMEIESKRRWMISTTSGFASIWTRDGKQIIYSTAGIGHRVEVRTSPDFSAGDPIPAFDLDLSRTGQVMDATRDGERLLVSFIDVDDESEGRPRVTVALNWFDEIEERIAGSGRQR